VTHAVTNSRADLHAESSRARQRSLALARGDERAWADLFDAWFDQSAALAARITGADRDTARDIAQDALLRAVKSIRPVDSDAQLHAFLRRLVHAAAIDRLRADTKRAAREHRSIRFDHTGTAPPIDPDALLAAIDSLPHDDRALLLERIARDRTLRQLADHHGLSIGAVHGRLRRLTVQLRAALDPRDHS